MIVTTDEDRKRKIKALVKTMVEDLGDILTRVELNDLDDVPEMLDSIYNDFEQIQDEVFVLQEGEED